MKAILEDFIHRCSDQECGGERLAPGIVKQVKLTLENGKRLVFDTREDARAAALKHGVTITEA